MATNEAEIKIQIDASDVQNIIGALQNLTRALNRTGDEFEEMGDEAKAAGRQVKSAESQVKGADRSLVTMTRTLAGAAAGFVAAKLTMETLKKGFDFLKASVEAATEANAEAKASLEVTSAAFTGLKVAIGETLISGEAGNELFGLFTETFDSLRRGVEDNKESIQTFVRSGLMFMLSTIRTGFDVLGPFLEFLNNMSLIVPTVRLALVSLANATLLWNSVIAEASLMLIGKLLEGFQSLLEGAGAVADFLGVDFAQEAIANVQSAVEGFEGGVDGAISKIDEFQELISGAQREAVADFEISSSRIIERGQAIEDIMDRGAAATSSLIEGMENGSIAANQQAAANERLAASLAGNDNSVSETAEKAQESLTKYVNALNELAGAEKLQAALDENKLAGAIKLQEAIDAQGQEKLDQALAIREARIDQATSIMSNSFESLGESISDAFTGDTSFGEAIGKLLGDILTSVGRTQIALGTLNLIPPPYNPTGNPAIGAAQIAGGVAAIAVGKALGAAGGGGGGRGGRRSGVAAPGVARSTPREAVEGGKNVVFNQTTSFGFVGDRRAATREIDDLNRKAVERGLS